MMSGRRRFDALPDDGYTESKITPRSRSPRLRPKSSGRSNPDSASGKDDPSSSDCLPDLYPEGPSKFQV
ncbi:unnamed protein product [Phytophthora fragariaefolia]|uniref:Unnamed protein product n=1 Tax=Phytophthora fragariaefolia TaxID=1490495 RepID=A0A9W6XJN5_9STRA|nr:unnamed protein product [Phytophthora fragariaefolia]